VQGSSPVIGAVASCYTHVRAYQWLGLNQHSPQSPTAKPKS